MPDTPILDAITAYSNAARLRLHMPGHKGSLPFLGGAARLDVTELNGLDDLSAPKGCICEAERLCAAAFGSKRAFFLVNGSSAGILAFLLSLGEGRRVVMERGAHRSLAHGAALAGHTVELLPASNDGGVPLPASLHDVKAALKVPAAAVCVTSPNYYGLCPDLEGIAALCKAAGALLFVDEAHGAHFIAGHPYPKSAAAFADAFVQSAHKTLPALTQSAYLHLNDLRLESALARSIRLVQSTSPSYLLMASLDYARAAFDVNEWRKLERRCAAFYERLDGLAGIARYNNEAFACDPSRLVIDVSGRLPAPIAAKELFGRGVAVEMCDHKRLVMIVTPEDGEAWPQTLIEALGALPFCGNGNPPPPLEPDMPAVAALYPRRAMLGETETIDISEAAHRTSADALGLYPPGTPLIWPGEQIDESMIQYMLDAERAGSTPFGLENGRVRVMRDGLRRPAF